jgi:2-C-methyl-D-erythritol 4-phosphate cytidylyltransferase/2-C-methyl-D-erythritol 2,4-cyclodiphosphate synthase
MLPRIGLGWDRHAVAAGESCVLAGVKLDCPVGPVGHSDADVLLHALTDALLGAAGMDDLGTLFPDTDPQWQGAASSQFVIAAVELLASAGLRAISVDMVVICDLPKIAPHRAAMRAKLAELLSLPVNRVNLKGKTTEGVPANGSAAIEVQAIVMLKGVTKSGGCS